MRIFRDRYLLIGLGALVVSVVCVSLAFAVSSNTHVTNSVGHGLSNFLAAHYLVPLGWTDPPGTEYSTVEVRHYADDGTFNVQCSRARNGYTECAGDWGSLPCHKRYVGGTDGLMSRHWMRANGCPGDLHGP
jgi:hypothetical protein